jgi:pimeloyl-ACP methyl ester carboxylesterase
MGRGAIVAGVVALSGCGYLHAPYSQNIVGDLATIHGVIVDPAPLDKPITVGVAQEVGDQTFQVINYAVSYVPAPFEFAVPPGTYYLFAFVDENENGQWDPAERAGVHGDDQAKKVVVQEGQTLGGIDIRLGVRDTAAIRSRIVLKPPEEATEELIATKLVVGEVTTLKDPRFDIEIGEFGHWQPVEFLQKHEAGVFMLEPYDPKRIPVLLTHGIEGTPRNFEKLIESVDKTKFQIWVVQYPSGLRLNLIARGVAKALDELQQRYRFDTLYMAAHSMGGLVMRSVIAKLAARPGPQYVKLLVTFATPWGGHRLASMSLKMSPIVVPVWIDMAVGSPFLAETTLPGEVPFHLLFGYVGSNGGDGVVSLESMLMDRMQDQAETVRGYPENHQGIVNAAAPLAEFNRILVNPGGGKCNR